MGKIFLRTGFVDAKSTIVNSSSACYNILRASFVVLSTGSTLGRMHCCRRRKEKAFDGTAVLSWHTALALHGALHIVFFSFFWESGRKAHAEARKISAPLLSDSQTEQNLSYKSPNTGTTCMDSVLLLGAVHSSHRYISGPQCSSLCQKTFKKKGYKAYMTQLQMARVPSPPVLVPTPNIAGHIQSYTNIHAVERDAI